MNTYNFTGRLGSDATFSKTAQGMTTCTFNVAVNYGFGENKGNNWIRCTLFGKRAESSYAESLKQGTMVEASGELRVRQYTDKENVQRTSVEVVPNSYAILSQPQTTKQNTGYTKQTTQAPRQSNTQQNQTGQSNTQQNQDEMHKTMDDDIPF